MASELELKAVVDDPPALRRALVAAGAVLRFHGMMRDRRLDRGGELLARDQVLRVRLWTAAGEPRALAEVAWKGPTSVSPEGYKHRDELELDVDDGALALRLFETLGYLVVQAIDRYVEVFELDGAVARMEWYPRMDVLLEIEGSPEGIEQVIRTVGLPREACRPDQLVAFAARYTERAGKAAILAESDLRGEAPTWSRK